MFIVGILVGPALAILAGDYLFKPGGLAVRWVVFAIVLIMLVVAFVPFFATELKVGLLISFPLGLLLATTPIAPLELQQTEKPARAS